MSRFSEILSQTLRSPHFVVDDMDSSKWYLKVYARESKKKRKEYMGVYLCRKKDDSPEVIMNVKYEIAFIGKDGSVLVSKTLASNFEKGIGRGFPAFVKREEVFDTKRTIFMPKDTLTVRCKIWKNGESVLQNVRCFARTRLRIERRSFMWNLENFSALESEKKYSYLIKSVRGDELLLSIDLFVTGEVNSEEVVRFKMSLKHESIEFFTIRLSLVDVSGNKIFCNKKEFWLESDSENENENKSDSDCEIECEKDNEHESEEENEDANFSFPFTRQNLLANKKLFLPNDVLSLHWEWSFSRKYLVSHEIEEVQYGCSNIGTKTSDVYEGSNEKIHQLNSLTDKLNFFYNNKFLCDVQLRTSTTTFQAHKIILSAFSSTFENIFSKNVEDSDCVFLENMNDDTAKRMLHYIYTSSVENLTLDSAIDLYEAGYKYAILGLKNICLSFILPNLSTSNALEALLCAEELADGYFKSAVLQYIEKHGKEMENSDWRHLMNVNGKLAAEALYRLFYKN
ncbi:unnamed protein product [Larinioides sclopetarius]|uniref:Speckle-type POZ protein n=1 Tax=Larinioides sclopetarius TaxID=280406 RepID=A0AAV2A8N2_9ARAC